MSVDENAIYMIGSAYNRLTDAKTTPEEDLYRIYNVDLKSNSKTIFYETDKRSIDRLLLSPDNNYISVTKYEKDLQTEILIIDKKLRIRDQSIIVPDGVLSYVWSPDSKKIAYMAGTYKESGKIELKGIWIYDLEKKEKKKIAGSALKIEWLPTGELCLYNEYIERQRDARLPVYKTLIYSDQANNIIAEKQGIYLSQDARYSTDPKYYLLPEDQVTRKIVVDFFDLKRGTIILGTTLDKVFRDPIRIAWGGDIIWLKGNRLVVEKRIRDSLLYDISICDFANNRILREVRGRIVGVNSDRSKLVIYSDGKFSAVDVP